MGRGFLELVIGRELFVMTEHTEIRHEVEIEDFFSRVLAVIGRTTDKEVANLLRRRRLTLATAESVTGGLLAGRLTATPGSSDYFIGGVVCYSNRIKVMELGIPAALIAEHGAVSSEVAVAMAEGICKRFRVGVGLATTGVAGPGSTTPPKAIGTVYVAVSSREGKEFKELNLKGTRREIRDKAVQGALGLLWLHLGGEEAREKVERGN